PWQVRPRDDPFYCYDNIDFIMQFPLSKDATIRLLNLNEHIIAFDGLCNCPLSPIIQLLVALRFYTTGTLHVVLGDLGSRTPLLSLQWSSSPSHHQNEAQDCFRRILRNTRIPKHRWINRLHAHPHPVAWK
ncbi:hypothetical protein HPB47_002377, partial [Ixodes persulcatus]